MGLRLPWRRGRKAARLHFEADPSAPLLLQTTPHSLPAGPGRQQRVLLAALPLLGRFGRKRKVSAALVALQRVHGPDTLHQIYSQHSSASTARMQGAAEAAGQDVRRVTLLPVGLLRGKLPAVCLLQAEPSREPQQ